MPIVEFLLWEGMLHIKILPKCRENLEKIGWLQMTNIYYPMNENYWGKKKGTQSKILWHNYLGIRGFQRKERNL